MDPRDDAELVLASAHGDRDAFGTIVVRYQNLICSLAFSALGDLSRSEDVAQETFLAAWKNLVQLREPSRFRSWLCGIARNQIRQTLRAEAREPAHRAEPLEDTDPWVPSTPPSAEQAISDEEAGILWRTLQHLPETYRVPLVLYYREQRSIEAVAQHLELSEPAVRQRLSRGRRLLEEEVLKFVESALSRSSPNHGFTRAVIAALPGAAAAKPAALAGAAGKGVSGFLSGPVLASAAAMVGASLLSWKIAHDDAPTPAMRRTLRRLGGISIACLILTLVAAFYLLPKLADHPALLGLATGAFIFANGGIAMVLNERLRRCQLASEPPATEGSPLPSGSAPGQTPSRPQATWRSFRWILPSLVLVASGALALPWQQHPGRSLLMVAAELLLILLVMMHFRRQVLSACPMIPPTPVLGTVGGRQISSQALPWILGACALIAAFIPLFLHPPPLHTANALAQRLGWIVLGISAATVSLVAMIHAFSRRHESPKAQTQASIHRIYQPFFDNHPDIRRRAGTLKRLIAQRTTAAANAIVAWTHGTNDPAPHLDHARQCDLRIHRLLGAQIAESLQCFERTLKDRDLIARFRIQHPASISETSNRVDQELLETLATARDAYSWSNGLSRRRPIWESPSIVFTTDQIDVFEREELAFIEGLRGQVSALLGPEAETEFLAMMTQDRRVQVEHLRAWLKSRNPMNPCADHAIDRTCLSPKD